MYICIFIWIYKTRTRKFKVNRLYFLKNRIIYSDNIIIYVYIHIYINRMCYKMKKKERARARPHTDESTALTDSRILFSRSLSDKQTSVPLSPPLLALAPALYSNSISNPTIYSIYIYIDIYTL